MPIHVELVFIISSEDEFLTGNVTDILCCQHKKYYEMSFKKVRENCIFLIIFNMQNLIQSFTVFMISAV